MSSSITSEQVRAFALQHDHVAIPLRPGVTITWTDEETGEVLGRATLKGRNVVQFPPTPAHAALEQGTNTFEAGKPAPYFCPACQGVPRAGYCKLAGCPTAPEQG